jgi:hypothetical protein
MLVTIRVPDVLLEDREIRVVSVGLSGGLTYTGDIVRCDREPVTHEEIRRAVGKCGKCGKPERAWHHCDEFRCEAPLIEREIA